jgi:uncharacterized RDD family membrane protein YckC
MLEELVTTSAGVAALPSETPPPVEPVALEPEPVAPVLLTETAVDPPAEPAPQAEAFEWKDEVSARMESYRARRKPKPPRYPSLMLQFDPEWGPPPTHTPEPEPAAIVQVDQALALDSSPVTVTSVVETQEPESTGKIIEFPRSSASYPAPLEELADPVLERPRILEAPEVAPLPPALGGILIESEKTEEAAKRPGIDVPLESSSVERRLAAAAIDGVIVLVAAAAFGAVVYRMASPKLPLVQLMVAPLLLFSVWWTAYQYLMMVYAGHTVGARLAKLQLLGFDGRPANQMRRRQRVLAATLSAAALGMGYAWHFLDEDGLCWHDRITHTHLGKAL